MTRQENGRCILDAPPLMRGNCLKNAPAIVAALHFDEGDQRATFGDDVELAGGSRIASRQDAPAGEPESQCAEPLRREAPLMSGPPRR